MVKFIAWLKERWSSMVGGADWLVYMFSMAFFLGMCVMAYSDHMPGLGTFCLILGALSFPAFCFHFSCYMERINKSSGSNRW